jgi:DHA3 family macrolide efflux protein-like MFS transporter
MGFAKDDKQSMLSFLLMWTGQALSLFGTYLVQFALVWHLTLTTGSATVLAISSMMALVPDVVLGPFAGALIDRWDRRTIMLVADAVTALATFVLALLFITGTIQVWHIYVAILVRAVGQTFHLPATLAATSMMVPPERLSQVSGLNQGLEGIMMILPPIIGAVLISFVPMHVILAVDIGAAALAMSILYFIRIPQISRHTFLTRKVTVLQDIVSGFKYVWGWPGLFILILICAGFNFFVYPAFALLPLVVTDHFKGAAPELAIVEAATAVGLITGGLIIAAWGGFKRRILSTIVFQLPASLMLLAFGLVPDNGFLLAVAAMAVYGTMTAMVNGPLMAIPQAAVEVKMQGRVLSLMNALTIGIAPIGLAFAGPISDQIGSRSWFVVAGAVSAVMTLGMLAIPAVMNIEDRARTRPAVTGPLPPQDLIGATPVMVGKPLTSGMFNTHSSAMFTPDELQALREAYAKRKEAES